VKVVADTLGVARSNLVEQIAASHSRAFGAGELKDTGAIVTALGSGLADVTTMSLRNAKTAKSIAEEVGIDEFVPRARPEDKFEIVRKEQALGRMVAMIGDGTNSLRVTVAIERWS